MKASKELIDAIKGFEGLRLEAYRCPAGVWTIGYGHTGGAIKEGLTITSDIAEELLVADIENVEKELSRFKLPDLNNHQWDAIVSFAYNLGCARFRTSSLYKKICANPNDGLIAKEFNKWIYGGGKILKGLVLRRKWEGEHYFKR